ncbi:hypothetical protein [Salirhabdus sp. Marseille-P4669]|uniref:hypothetical protein n=1 Tax=Salirhabdus sp. Marseille-P4669 TaxID=2042310 RepID=UPI000C7D5935|nr:hypothetical protein [Salirhabdus sp. Marseille-P4669]
MKDFNKELSNLSKNLASVTVASVLRKHQVKDDKTKLNNLPEEQKEELRNIAKNLEDLVNQYSSGEDMEGSEEQVKQVLSEDSPLRMLLNKKKKERDS